MKDIIDFPLEKTAPTGAKAFLLLDRPLPRGAGFVIPSEESLSLSVVDLFSGSYASTLSFRLGERSSLTIEIASLLGEGAEKELTIEVSHEGKESFSRVRFVGINLSDKPFRFRGNSYIPNGIHGCDTRQEGRITNLSPNCLSEVSPALFIKDNDVRASHGAALGTYDADVLYYLTSRGISLSESKRLVTFGYLMPIVEKLADEKAVALAKRRLEEIRL